MRAATEPEGRGDEAGPLHRVLRSVDILAINPLWLEEERGRLKGPVGSLLSIAVSLAFVGYVAYLAAQNEARPDSYTTVIQRLDAAEPLRVIVEWNPEVVNMSSILPLEQSIHTATTICQQQLTQMPQHVTLNEMYTCPLTSSYEFTLPSARTTQGALAGPGFAFQLNDTAAVQFEFTRASSFYGTPLSDVFEILRYEAVEDCDAQPVRVSSRLFVAGIANAPSSHFPYEYIGIYSLVTSAKQQRQVHGTKVSEGAVQQWRAEGFHGTVKQALVYKGMLLVLGNVGTGADVVPQSLWIWNGTCPQVWTRPVRAMRYRLRAEDAGFAQMALWQDMVCFAGLFDFILLADSNASVIAADVVCWNGTAWLPIFGGVGSVVSTREYVHAIQEYAGDLFIAVGPRAVTFAASTPSAFCGRVSAIAAHYATSNGDYLGWESCSNDFTMRFTNLYGEETARNIKWFTEWDAKLCIAGALQVQRIGLPDIVLSSGVACFSRDMRADGTIYMQLDTPQVAPAVSTVGLLVVAGKLCMPTLLSGSSACTGLLCWNSLTNMWDVAIPCQKSAGMPTQSAARTYVAWNNTICFSDTASTGAGGTTCWNGTAWSVLKLARPILNSVASTYGPLVVWREWLCGALLPGKIGCHTGDRVVVMGNTSDYIWTNGAVTLHNGSICVSNFKITSAAAAFTVGCWDNETLTWSLIPSPPMPAPFGMYSTDGYLCVQTLQQQMPMQCWLNGSWVSLSHFFGMGEVTLPWGDVLVTFGPSRAGKQSVPSTGLVRASRLQDGSIFCQNNVETTNQFAYNLAATISIIGMAKVQDMLCLHGAFIATVNGATVSSLFCINATHAIRLGSGVSSNVLRIVYAGGILYAVGDFRVVDNRGFFLSYAALWNGAQWESTGVVLSGTVPSHISSPVIRSALQVDNDIYFVGGFVTVADQSQQLVNGLVRWSPTLQKAFPLGTFTHSLSWQLAAANQNKWVARLWPMRSDAGKPLVLNISDVLYTASHGAVGVQQHTLSLAKEDSYRVSGSYGALSSIGVGFPRGGIAALGGPDSEYPFCPPATAVFKSAASGTICCVVDISQAPSCVGAIKNEVVFVADTDNFPNGWLHLPDGSWQPMPRIESAAAFFLAPEQIYTQTAIKSTKETAFVLLGTAMGTLGMMLTVARFFKRGVVRRFTKADKVRTAPSQSKSDGSGEGTVDDNMGGMTIDIHNPLARNNKHRGSQSTDVKSAPSFSLHHILHPSGTPSAAASVSSRHKVLHSRNSFGFDVNTEKSGELDSPGRTVRPSNRWAPAPNYLR